MEQPHRLAVPILPVGAWILIATVLNIVLATSAGSGYDNAIWANSIQVLQHGGIGALSPDYPPMYAYWLWLCGKLLGLFQLQAQAGLLLHFLVNTPVLACHAILLLLVDRAQRGLPDGERLPWLLPFTALNPALLVDGPMWGQVDLVYSLMLAAALQLLVSGRLLYLAVPLLAAAFLTKLQAVCILPVILPLLWRRRSPALWGGVLMALLLIDLALLPYWISGTAMRMLQTAYFSAPERFTSASMNAWNLWFLLGLNNVNDGLQALDPAQYPAFLVQLSAPRLLGGLLFAGWSLWLLVSTARTGDPQRVWRNVLLSACGFFLLLPDMQQRYLFPAAPLALLAAASYAGFGLHAIVLSVLAALNVLFVLGMQADGPVPYLASLVLVLYIGGWAAWPRLSRMAWVARLRQRVGTMGLRSWLALSALLWAVALILHLAHNGPKPDSGPPMPQAVDGWIDATAIPGVSATQGWGILHFGESVDGHPLRVGGQPATHGFGTHAPSQMKLPIPPQARRFTVSAGIDDEIAGGRVAFLVFLDGKEVWNSGAMVAGDAPRTLDLDVSGHHSMELVVDSLGDKDFDHSDWLEPRFQVGP